MDYSAIQTTVQSVLSGIREKRLSLVDSLTSTPFHPYEKLKYMYLDQQGLSAKNIDDLPPVSAFNLAEATVQLTSINQRVVDDYLTRVPGLTGVSVFDNPQIGNIFATLSANEYVVNEQALTKHLEHIELVRHVTAEQIDKNPIEVAQKLINHFIQTYK